MSWDWLRENVGGAADWLTGGRTDFDQRGSSGGGLWGDQVNPWFGGSDNQWGPEADWVDKGNAFLNSFKTPAGSPTAAGSSFLKSQTQPAATAVTGPSGSTGTLGDDVAIFNPPPFVALKDNPEPPSSSGGSSSGSTGNKLLNFAGTALGVAKLFGLCDIRTKTDISPLEITEVNDDLAQLAFFVKGIRECS